MTTAEIIEVNKTAYLVYVPLDDLQNLQKESEILNQVRNDLEILKGSTAIEPATRQLFEDVLDSINKRL